MTSLGEERGGQTDWWLMVTRGEGVLASGDVTIKKQLFEYLFFYPLFSIIWFNYLKLFHMKTVYDHSQKESYINFFLQPFTGSRMRQRLHETDPSWLVPGWDFIRDESTRSIKAFTWYHWRQIQIIRTYICIWRQCMIPTISNGMFFYKGNVTSYH